MTEPLDHVFLPDSPEPPAVAAGFGHERTDGSCDWWTPPHIFKALGMHFDLDPCAPALPSAPWIPAKHRMTIESDGLSQGWFGNVWLNPPYGRAIGQWVGRFIEHGRGIALTFARTDTGWWQALAEKADLVCFLDTRVRFVNGDTNKIGDPAGAPATLCAYGDDAYVALRQSNLGLCTAMAGIPSRQLTLSASPGTVDA